MTERAAHWVDEVVPPVPVRQWVLTLPYRLRYLLAWDHGLSRARGTAHRPRPPCRRRRPSSGHSPT